MMNGASLTRTTGNPAIFVGLVYLLLSVSLILLAAIPLYAAYVSNENVRQVGNRILFEFDIDGGTNEEAHVSLTLTINGKQYTAGQLHLEGDFGKTKTGKGRKIYWNVLQDFPGGLSSNMHWDLTVDNGTAFKDPITGMEFVFVRGGCYQMGSPAGETGRSDDEGPVHEVCVDDYYMGKNNVTVGQFSKFVNETGYRTDAENDGGCYVWKGNGFKKDNKVTWLNPGFLQDDKHPVTCVSWNDAKEFSAWLSRKTGKRLRLPTEAEWEYAARGGTRTSRYWGDIPDETGSFVNIADSTAKKQFGNLTVHNGDDGYSYALPEGSSRPNAFGLYDMLGNLWQWTQDWYDINGYRNSPRYNPQGPSLGDKRVLRGGSWGYYPRYARSALRFYAEPGYRRRHIGFRLLMTP